VYFPFFQFLNLCPKVTEKVNIERKWVVPFVFWDSQPPFQGKYKSILKKLWYLQTFPTLVPFQQFWHASKISHISNIFQLTLIEGRTSQAVIANESS